MHQSRRFSRLKIVAAALLSALVLSACQTTTGPSADSLKRALEQGVALERFGFVPPEDLRVRYLSSVGNDNLVGEFVRGLPVEVATFRLGTDGEATGTPLRPVQSMGDGVSVAGDVYTLLWAATDPAVAERVRIEIRLPGSGDQPVCGADEGECLGAVDVRIVERSGPGSGGGSSDTLLTIPSGTTLQVRFKVLVPEDLAGLAEVSGQGGIDVELGSCAANDYAMPSQGLQAVGAGLQAVGAAGGLFLAPASALVGETVTTSWLAGALTGAVERGAARDVAVVVLDDFGGVFSLPDAVTKGKLTDLDLGALVASGRLSHGSLVLHELQEMFGSAIGKGKSVVMDGLPATVYSSRGNRVALVAADARAGGAIDTEVAADALSRAIAAASAAGYRDVVVNMSFAIVPCGVLEDIERAGSTSFEEYTDALLDLNGVSGDTAAALGRMVPQPVDLLADALLSLLSCPSGGACDGMNSVTFVAASGNYGLGFPLYPAAHPSVVSVGSQSTAAGSPTSTPSGFSNAAGVLAAGDLVHLRSQGQLALAYAGTSFSAPVVAAFSALDQRSGNPRCAPGGPNGAGADLAFPGTEELPLLPTFASGGGDAVGSYCGD